MLPIYRNSKVDEELLNSLSKKEVDVLLKIAKGNNVAEFAGNRAQSARLEEIGLLTRQFGNLRLSFTGQDTAAVLQRMNGKNIAIS